MQPCAGQTTLAQARARTRLDFTRAHTRTEFGADRPEGPVGNADGGCAGADMCGPAVVGRILTAGASDAALLDGVADSGRRAAVSAGAEEAWKPGGLGAAARGAGDDREGRAEVGREGRERG